MKKFIISIVALVISVVIISTLALKVISKHDREIPSNTEVVDRGIPVFEDGQDNSGGYTTKDTFTEDEAEDEPTDVEKISEDESEIDVTEENYTSIESKGAADSPSQSIVQTDPQIIPDYSGEISISLNNNIPGFNEYDIEYITGDYYSEIDSLGRCGVAYAMLERTLMPTDERGSIGQVKPSGWNQEKYPGIVDSEPPYLYNRCHLIAYSLTGQNANERNLITGTRYFNINGMLGYERAVADCVEYSGYHVLYRVTPYFRGDELLARGVEIEAYSVEDKGKEVCFHVFIYNVQPGIILNYSDGSSSLE